MTFARIENNNVVLAEREEVRNFSEHGESTYPIATLEAIIAIQDSARLSDALWFYRVTRNCEEYLWVTAEDLATELAAANKGLENFMAYYSKSELYEKDSWEMIPTIVSMSEVKPYGYEQNRPYEATTGRGKAHSDRFKPTDQLLLVKISEEEFAERTKKFSWC